MRVQAYSFSMTVWAPVRQVFPRVWNLSPASDFQKALLVWRIPGPGILFLIEKFHGEQVSQLSFMMIIYTGADLRLAVPGDDTDWSFWTCFGFDLFERPGDFQQVLLGPNRVRNDRKWANSGKLLYNEDDIKAELTKNVRRVAESAQKTKKSVELLSSRSVIRFNP